MVVVMRTAELSRGAARRHTKVTRLMACIRRLQGSCLRASGVSWLEFCVQGVKFRVPGSELRVQFVFRGWGTIEFRNSVTIRVQGSGFMVSGSGLRVQFGFGFGVQFGFRVSGTIRVRVSGFQLGFGFWFQFGFGFRVELRLGFRVSGSTSPGGRFAS